MGQQERPSLSYLNLARPSAAVWIGSPFCAALGLAVLVTAALGPGERATDVALQATARLSSLLFWPVYTAGALTALFGPRSSPSNGVRVNLASHFASAHLVHLALVAWLTRIGAAPPLGTFVIFGVAVLWTYLVLFSITRLQQALGSWGW
jgi:hypothetical protein